MGRLNTSCNTMTLINMPEGFANSYTLVDMEWRDSTLPGAHAIWTDGINTYDSYSTTHCVLEKETRTWKRKVFYGLDDISFSASNIWTDGENTYYSTREKHYVLNKETDTWEPKVWNGLDGLDRFEARFIWTDGKNIYYSHDSDQLSLDLETDTWSNTYFDYAGSFWTLRILGHQIWTDGISIYVPYDRSLPDGSHEHEMLVYNSNPRRFTKAYTTEFSFNGNCVWTDGTDVYYTDLNVGDNYILNKETNAWEPISYEGFWPYHRNDIWSDGENIYAISDGHWFAIYPYNRAIMWNKEMHEWELVSFSGPASLYNPVWTDGMDIYYDDQLVLDKLTSTWERKTWNWQEALTYSFAQDNIWTDGKNIYYSSDHEPNQYVLDRDTSTWSIKTWSGMTSFDARFIWTDGDNIYYSDFDSYSDDTWYYVLNKETSTWEPKTWYGLTKFRGLSIWTDGNNIYYRDSYILNKETSTWEAKSWNWGISADEEYFWSDGAHTYYSRGEQQYILSGDTLELVNWRAILQGNNKLKFESVPFVSSDIWTDGNNIYLGYMYKLINNNESKIVCMTEDGWTDLRGGKVEDAEIIVPLEDEIIFTPSDSTQRSDPTKYYKRVIVNPVKTQALTVTPSLEEQTLYYDYTNQSYISSVTVEPADITKLKALCGITMESLPKTRYKLGDKLSTDGGIIKRQFTDGSYDRINLKASDITGWGPPTAYGERILTVTQSRGGVTCKTQYTIIVSENGEDDSFTPVFQEKTATENGLVTPDYGYNGLSKVIVDVPTTDEPVLQTKTITENGTYTPDYGYNGLSKVVVNVPAPKLASLSATVKGNGEREILTPEGYDGLSSVNLTVHAYSTVSSIEEMSKLTDVYDGMIVIIDPGV